MRRASTAVPMIALGLTCASTPLLAQSRASAGSPDSCAHSPVAVGSIDDTVYGSLRSLGRDTLPTWYSQVLLNGLIEHFTPPTPLDIPVVGGRIRAPVHTHTAARKWGMDITALGPTSPGADDPRSERDARRSAPAHPPLEAAQPRTIRPESVSVAITAEVEFAVHRDGTLGSPRVFTSSLSPAFDASLVHVVSAFDSARALLPLPAPIRGDSLVLVFAAYDFRDSASVQVPLFHATLPIWIADHSVVARSNNPAPLYPPNAERAHIGDGVLYSFVVDATGTPRMETLRLLHGKYQDFQRAVLAVLPKWRFYPASIAGCPVAQSVQLPFAFNMGY